MRHPEWSVNATLYEVNIRQYTSEGTFRAFAEHLPRLKEMGIKILWLMPVNPIGSEKRKGTLGSYYSISHYREINSEFGNFDDFKYLVSKIHELGMYVIIDWVADHTSWDNHLIKDHPEWYLKDENGQIISPVEDWTDVAGLDYSNEDLADYMTETMIWWVKETDIDGFRCDVAGMLPVEFWNQAIPLIMKEKEVFMLAEWETPELHDAGFDATYSWETYYLINDIAKGKKEASEIDKLISIKENVFPADAIRLRFTSNHDENSWNGSETERLGPAAKAFAAFTFLIPGMPLIYSGQESAFKKRLSFFEKDQIQWSDFALSYFYSTLIYLKRRKKAIWCQPEGGEIVKIRTDQEESVYAFSRTADTDTIAGLFNFSSENISFRIKKTGINGTFRDIFSNSNIEIYPGTQFHLKPWEFKIIENY